METTIQQAEAEAARLEAQLVDPATVADHRKSADLYRALGEAQARVTALYDRWAELESKA